MSDQLWSCDEQRGTVQGSLQSLLGGVVGSLSLPWSGTLVATKQTEPNNDDDDWTIVDLPKNVPSSSASDEESSDDEGSLDLLDEIRPKSDHKNDATLDEKKSDTDDDSSIEFIFDTNVVSEDDTSKTGVPEIFSDSEHEYTVFDLIVNSESSGSESSGSESSESESTESESTETESSEDKAEVYDDPFSRLDEASTRYYLYSTEDQMDELERSCYVPKSSVGPDHLYDNFPDNYVPRKVDRYGSRLRKKQRRLMYSDKYWTPLFYHY